MTIPPKIYEQSFFVYDSAPDVSGNLVPEAQHSTAQDPSLPHYTSHALAGQLRDLYEKDPDKFHAEIDNGMKRFLSLYRGSPRLRATIIDIGLLGTPGDGHWTQRYAL
ncbi:hypothetical protein ACJZ2D_006602 [Fusarium nematophilum]